MKLIRPSLLVTAAFSLALVAIAVFNSQSTTAQQTPPGREVKVVNAPTEPVPVGLSPDASIRVSNFPSFPFPTSVNVSKQNWEYLVIRIPASEVSNPYTYQIRLNELGGQGWEVVYEQGGLIILKRPK